MAYTNNPDNTNFYPFSTYSEFDVYPSQTSAIGQENFETFTSGWGMDEQLGHMVNEPTNLGAEANVGEYATDLSTIAVSHLLLSRVRISDTDPRV